MHDDTTEDLFFEGEMQEAERAEEEGDYRKAYRLYNRLGKDIQAQHGRFDPRAVAAFEGVARSIGKLTA